MVIEPKDFTVSEIRTDYESEGTPIKTAILYCSATCKCWMTVKRNLGEIINTMGFNWMITRIRPKTMVVKGRKIKGFQHDLYRTIKP